MNKNTIFLEREAENAQHLWKLDTEAEEMQRTINLDAAQDHRNIFFSRLMFLSATSPLVLCMYKFILNVFLLVEH